MAEVVDDLTLEVGDETNQMRIKGTIMKVIKKLINNFIIKIDILKKYY